MCELKGRICAPKACSQEVRLVLPTIQMVANEPIHPANRDSKFLCNVCCTFTRQVTPQDLPIALRLGWYHAARWPRRFWSIGVHNPKNSLHCISHGLP